MSENGTHVSKMTIDFAESHSAMFNMRTNLVNPAQLLTLGACLRQDAQDVASRSLAVASRAPQLVVTFEAPDSSEYTIESVNVTRNMVLCLAAWLAWKAGLMFGQIEMALQQQAAKDARVIGKILRPQ